MTNMIKLKSTFVLSLELALIAMSIASLVYSFGVHPYHQKKQQQWIDQHSKSIAVQFSIAVQTGSEKTIENLVKLSTEQYPELKSVAIKVDGKTAVGTKGHDQFWQDKSELQKKLTNVIFEIPRKNSKPLQLQLCYTPEADKWYKTEGFKVSTLVFTGTFLVYLLLFRKMFTRIVNGNGDNSEQVHEIFNTMTEAVVITDTNEDILLANSEFLKLVGLKLDEIKGVSLNRFEWKGKKDIMPWSLSLQKSKRVKGIQISIVKPNGKERLLIVNSTPIYEEGKLTGLMVTMNDVTILHTQNEKIKTAMVDLRSSHEQIQSQNEVLKKMSMQDPLTGCLNRRAFFEIFGQEWSGTDRYDYELSCIMMDIDFFKKINDNYGHSKGDEVLKTVSALIQEHLRKTDYVCRYGGEEFCLLMTHTDIDNAAAAAEKIRALIEASKPGQLRTTVSIGITSRRLNAGSPEELIDQADKALYHSKHNGRNQLTRWDELPAEEQVTELESGAKEQIER